MGVASVRQALADRLRSLPNIDALPDEVPAQLVEDRTMLVYAVPGDASILAHAGKHGGVVYQATDRFIIEWHWRIDADRLSEAVPLTEEMVDLTRHELMRGFGADRFGGTVMGIDTIRTTVYGDLGWGSDQTFGFRISVDLIHGDEV